MKCGVHGKVPMIVVELNGEWSEEVVRVDC